MKAWGVVATVALTLALVLPAGAAAKPGFSVERPQRWSEFSLSATNGYRIRVRATGTHRRAHGKAFPNIFVSASKGLYNVEYLTRGRSAKDGAIEAKLPGLGRVAVRFVSARVTHESVADNCKGRDSVVRQGVFRGTIALHGERGYTTLQSTTARGKVTESFRQVCDERESGTNEESPAGSLHQITLYAGTKEGTSAIDFSASLTDFGPKFPGPGAFFTASSTKRRHGLYIVSSATAQGSAAQFSAPDPSGSLEDATVEPPSPFQGSASFHLNLPTSSSWTGTLGVELPGVGWVALAGAGFWSALCENNSCTETLPSNVQIVNVSFGSN